jgi:hypothetical protein
VAISLLSRRGPDFFGALVVAFAAYVIRLVPVAVDSLGVGRKKLLFEPSSKIAKSQELETGAAVV